MNEEHGRRQAGRRYGDQELPLPELRLWRRPVLPHDGCLPSQGKAAGPRRPSEEAMQALGAHLAEGSGVDA